MIKIFILNIVVSIIHFVSVETTNQGFDKMIKTGNTYGIFSSNNINSPPVCSTNITSDSSNNCNIKFFGYPTEINKSKIFSYQVFNYKVVENDYSTRFRYYESGNSPPGFEIACFR
jgi:hypothetical protein